MFSKYLIIRPFLEIDFNKFFQPGVDPDEVKGFYEMTFVSNPPQNVSEAIQVLDSIMESKSKDYSKDFGAYEAIDFPPIPNAAFGKAMADEARELLTRKFQAFLGYIAYFRAIC